MMSQNHALVLRRGKRFHYHPSPPHHPSIEYSLVYITYMNNNTKGVLIYSPFLWRGYDVTIHQERDDDLLQEGDEDTELDTEHLRESPERGCLLTGGVIENCKAVASPLKLTISFIIIVS